MSEFDKWWEENCMTLSADRTEAEDIYNLGVESQQAKIDELQGRIDAINEIIEKAKKLRSGNYLINEIGSALKGKQNETII